MELFATGLVYDIFGVGILALAFALPRIQTLYSRSQVAWGGMSKPMFKLLFLQRIDARFGLPILATGFLLQLISAWIPIVPPLIWAGVFLPLSFVLVAYDRVREGAVAHFDIKFEECRRQAKQKNESDGAE